MSKYKVGENWIDEYAKHVDIYQGRSFWHDFKDLVVKLKNRIINH